jgi:hypothetical protein
MYLGYQGYLGYQDTKYRTTHSTGETRGKPVVTHFASQQINSTRVTWVTRDEGTVRKNLKKPQNLEMYTWYIQVYSLEHIVPVLILCRNYKPYK